MSSYYQVQTYPVPGCGSNYYSGANNNNLDCTVNVNDNNTLNSEKELISNTILEAINRYGIPVSYYVHTYNLSSADNIYGEDPTSTFFGPTNVIMYIQLDESSVTLKRFGFDSGDELTAYVHISAYQNTFSPLSVYPTLAQAVEPKAGDVFQLTQYGVDRPGDRNGKFFEITERVDQDISNNLNILGGHYMWKLRARRMDYSFEPGLSGEAGKDQVFENLFNGLLSGGQQAESDSKAYPGDIDEISAQTVFDQSIYNTGIYGDYDY